MVTGFVIASVSRCLQLKLCRGQKDMTQNRFGGDFPPHLMLMCPDTRLVTLSSLPGLVLVVIQNKCSVVQHQRQPFSRTGVK